MLVTSKLPKAPESGWHSVRSRLLVYVGIKWDKDANEMSQSCNSQMGGFSLY